MVFPLFELAPELVISVLSRWVNLNALVRLDSACNSHTSRAQFTTVVSAQNFFLETMCCGIEEEHVICHLKWLTKRGVRTRSWEFRCDISPALLLEFVTKTAGDHVATIHLTGIHEETAGIFTTIFGGCMCITDILIEDCSHWTGVRTMSGEAQIALQKLQVKLCGSECTATFRWNNFPNLKCLYLEGEYATDVVSSLLKSATSLVDLRLNGVMLEDAGLHALLNTAEQLRTLVLTACNHITGAGVATLAERCVNLTCVGIATCAEVGDEAVESFALSCPALGTVGLEGTYTEASVLALATHRYAELRYLYLGTVNFTASAALLALAEKCARIQELNIAHCQGVTADCLLLIVTSLPCLRELIVEGCPNVTDAVLTAIVMRLPTLRALSLYGSAGYTTAGALAVIRTLRRLKHFSIEAEHAVLNTMVISMWEDAQPELTIHYGGLYSSKFSDFEW
jgi:hypothetical protein